MSKGPERTYTDRLLAVLRAIPFSEWDKIGAGPWQTPGLPDIIGCVRGTYVAVEVKQASRAHTANGGLTALQVKKIQALQQAGARVLVVYTSADLSKVRASVEQAVIRAHLPLPLPMS